MRWLARLVWLPLAVAIGLSAWLLIEAWADPARIVRWAEWVL